MREEGYQEKFVEERFRRFPNHVFVPFFELKYELGKYYKGKEFGMPDTVLNVVEFGSEGHIYSVKNPILLLKLIFLFQA